MFSENKSRALLLSLPAVVVAIYFAIGYYLAPCVLRSPNEMWYVVSQHGSFSAVFLANFIFDGSSNVVVFAIYVGIFCVSNLLLAGEVIRGRTLLLVSGMLAVPLIPEVVSRLWLTPTIITSPAGTIVVTNIAYGQSGVLASAMGIIFVFTILTILRGDWVSRLSFAGGLTYGIILGLLSGIEFMLFQGLFTPIWVAEIVHLGSLFIGMVLAVVYYFLVERRGEGRTERIGAILIPESEVRA